MAAFSALRVIITARPYVATHHLATVKHLPLSMKPVVVLAVAAILLSTVDPVHAQVVGQRVRVTERSGVTNTGIIVDRSETGLTIGLDHISGAAYRVSFTDIQTLAISLREHSYAKAGLLVGGIAGAVSWVLLCDGCSTRGALGGGILFSALLTALGGGAGKLIKKERWTILPVPGQAASLVEPLVGVRPSGQPVVGVRLTF